MLWTGLNPFLVAVHGSECVRAGCSTMFEIAVVIQRIEIRHDLLYPGAGDIMMNNRKLLQSGNSD